MSATGVARSRPYEPIIVRTLRRYVQRGASQALLRRLAGGPGQWRWLDQAWNLEGRPEGLGDGARSEVVLDERMPDLSTAERRIALELISLECVETGAVFPKLIDLADYFGVHWMTIDNDLRQLRRGGAADWRIETDGVVPRRAMVSP